MEDALYEIESMRHFAGLALIDDALPDETTILNFRCLLETHQLTGRMMNVVNDVLEDRGLLLKGGTMVDATIIHAPPPTKNRAKARDPQMHQTKQGKQWYFGMKIHVGADVHSGLTHTVSVTAAHAGHQPVAGPAAGGRPGRIRRQGLREQSDQAGGPPGRCLLGGGPESERAPPPTAANRRTNRRWSRTRSRAEHIFRVIKRQFGYTQVRYTDLAKNAGQIFTLIGLTNLYRVPRRLLA